MFTTIMDDTINLTDISRISRKHRYITIHFISKKDSESYYFETPEDAANADRVIMNDMKAFKIMIEHNPRD